MFDESIYREPTEEECLSGVEFEIYTYSGWVMGTYPSILLKNKELDEFGDDNEMKLAHAITRLLKSPS